MKTIKIFAACLLLAGCSRPDPTGLYLINNSWSQVAYDIQSSGKAKISGQINFHGIRSSFSTTGNWRMEGNTLVVSAPKPESVEPGGRVTDHKFNLESNGDLVTLSCEEFDEGIRAVKQ